MKYTPHNPGLSQKAWVKVHKLVAAANLKHAAEIREGRLLKEEKKVG